MLHSHLFSRPQLTIHLCLYRQFNQRETSWSNAEDSTSTNILRGSLTTCTISKTKVVASPLVPITSPVKGPLISTIVPGTSSFLKNGSQIQSKTSWLPTIASISRLASWCYSMQSTKLEKTIGFSSLATCQRCEG